MVEEIICEFWNVKYNIGKTKDNKLFALVDGKVKSVLKESHCGSIHYRIKGSDSRISANKLNKEEEDIIKNKLIQFYTPF